MKKSMMIILVITLAINSFGSIIDTSKPNQIFTTDLGTVKIFTNGNIRKKTKKEWERISRESSIDYKLILAPLCIDYRYSYNEGRFRTITHNSDWGPVKETIQEIRVIKSDKISSSYLGLINILVNEGIVSIHESYKTYIERPDVNIMFLEIKIYDKNKNGQVRNSKNIFFKIDFQLTDYRNIIYDLDSAEVYEKSNMFLMSDVTPKIYKGIDAMKEFAVFLRDTYKFN